MAIEIVKENINQEHLNELAKEQFGDMVKAVIDIEQGIMAIGGELHADEEIELVEKCGSKREFTWGINLYPEKAGEDFIEFDSMINLKPQFGNRSRSVENEEIQNKIREVAGRLIS